jgi:cytochrome b561
MQTTARYPMALRILHWIIAVCVIVLIPIGLLMVSRGEANIWDTLTNTLYAWHKAIGFAVLWLMVIRILIKLLKPSLPYTDDIPPVTLLAARTVHLLMYILLIVVPLLGWAGITAYPALNTIGGYHLPAFPFIEKGETFAKQLFNIHGLLGLTLGVLALAHIAAACKHLLINRDNVFKRMWFGKT